MIELDNTKTNTDLLSDEQRSGFEPDNESFSFGAPPVAVPVASAPSRFESSENESLPFNTFTSSLPSSTVIANEMNDATTSASTTGQQNVSTNPRVISIPSESEQRRMDEERARQSNQHVKTQIHQQSRRRTEIVALILVIVLVIGAATAAILLFSNNILPNRIGNFWSSTTSTNSVQPVSVQQNSSEDSTNISLDSRQQSGQTTALDSDSTTQARSTNGVFIDSKPTTSAQTQTEQQQTAQLKSGIANSAPSDSITPSNKPAQFSSERAQQQVEKQSGKQSGTRNSGLSTSNSKKQEPTSSDKNRLAFSPTVSKTKLPSHLPLPLPSKPIIANARKPEKPLSAPLNTGVFAVQVYATPSIDDAEAWLKRLEQRGMLNPVVTSQVIRGQLIYRIRFGLYESLQSAERDAARFGYTGSWVVRLR
jgi:SPOR domain